MWLAQIEVIGIHDFVPGGNEVAHELGVVVVLGIDFGDGAQLGVGTKDQVDAGGSSYRGAADAVLGDITVVTTLFPLDFHAQQRFEPAVVEGGGGIPDAFAGAADAECAQATHQHRHFDGG